MKAVRDYNGTTFILHGPGGTGKTHLQLMLFAQIRSEGHIALASASTESYVSSSLVLLKFRPKDSAGRQRDDVLVSQSEAEGPLD